MSTVINQGTRWTQLTLAVQFLMAGAVVMLVAMLIVGNWVSANIKAMVVHNSAINTADLVANFVTPYSRELAYSNQLSEDAKRSLQANFETTSLSERVVSYKIWVPGGEIVYASNPDVIGLVFDQEEALIAAFNGQVYTSFIKLARAENRLESQLGMPLLEVY